MVNGCMPLGGGFPCTPLMSQAAIKPSVPYIAEISASATLSWVSSSR